MCLATPMKLIKVEKGLGFVEHGGKEYKVNLDLIDNPKIGDWILAHADLAVSRLPEKEALEILELISTSEE
jgi:hydrogenase expression/formation protein HypC